MNEELKQYLQNSKDSRDKLVKLAKDIEVIRIKRIPKLKSYKNLGFPEVSLNRFREFEEGVMNDLQNYFKQKPVNEAFNKRNRVGMYRKGGIAAVYKPAKSPTVKPSLFLPIRCARQKSNPERVTSYKDQDHSIHSSPTLASNISVYLTSNSLTKIKQKLLTPILKQKASNPHFAR